MYERNAIVLERYFCKKFGYQEPNNLKTNFENYCNLLEKIEQFQIEAEEEKKISGEFEEVSARFSCYTANARKII